MFIDATMESNVPFADSLGVDGYPSIIVYKDGRRLLDYTGGRTTA